MIKKSIVFFFALLSLILIAFLVVVRISRNIWCGSERFPGDFEIIGWTCAFDISDRIRSGECECISRSLIRVTQPRAFTHEQIMKIKGALPIWAGLNVPDFSGQDQKDLIETFSKLSDVEFLDKLTYRYSFIPMTDYKEVPVYTIRIFNGLKFTTAYLPNYQDVLEFFANNPIALDFNSNKMDPATIFKNGKPVYSSVESELWAREKFGEIGVIKLWWPYYLHRGI